ncbi:MAG: hypothetical protein ACE5G0_10460 [Rhodothermales bacterium]
MATFLPNCVRIDETGRHWAGVHIEGAGTQWQLMPKKGTIVRPPPGNLCCEVCQRPPEELPRFGGPGDPLPADYTEAILVKRSRSKGILGSSWECRDCIILSENEYLRTLTMR